MVDELAGGVVRAIASLLHAIFQIIFEALLRVLFEIVFEIFGRIFSAIFRCICFIGRLLLWPADLAYAALFARIRRRVHRVALAHACAVALLMASGFMIGAGASLVYHRTPGAATAASLLEQP